LCGADEYAVVIAQAKELYNGMEEYFDVVRCSECSMVWTNPRPTPETIGYFYPDSAGYFQPSKDVTNPAGGLDTAMAAFLEREFGYSSMGSRGGIVVRCIPTPLLRRRARITHIPRWVPGGRILDIGCSWGRYLASMRALGWAVDGIEPHEPSAEFARTELGIENIRLGTVEEIPLEPGAYDVIQGSMVLEHVHAPRDVLAKLHTGLRHDGQLILAVPDFSGLEARLFGRNAYTLQVPEHLNHFTPRTARRMLDLAGFRVDRIVHHHFERDWIAGLEYANASPTLLRVVKQRHVRRFLVRPAVYLQGILGMTSRMSIYASPL